MHARFIDHLWRIRVVKFLFPAFLITARILHQRTKACGKHDKSIQPVDGPVTWPEKVHKKHDTDAIRIIMYFVLQRIVKDKNLARLPVPTL